MTGDDEQYIRELIQAGVIQSPCLEIGAGLPEHSLKSMLRAAGIDWFGTDLKPNQQDVLAMDFDADPDAILRAFENRRFQTVLLLNVIEHVFDPIRVLDTACRLLVDGGQCVVVAPSVWPLHYFPLDCWRINPNFFEEYCKRRKYELVDRYFRYVSPGNTPIPRDEQGHPMLPVPSGSKLRYWKSKVVHRAFDTFGRAMPFPAHVTTGAVIRVSQKAP